MKKDRHWMKRVFSMILALAMIMTMMPVTAFAADTDTTVYLVPNSNWLEANARFAIYCFGNGETWVDMSDADGDGMYEGTVPAGYPSIIFCRMNPGTTANGWDNKWNQTNDLTVPTDGTNCYTVADGTWDNGGGTWSTYTPEVEEPETETTGPADSEEEETTTVYFQNNWNWTDVKIYCWDSNNNVVGTAWPGDLMTFVENDGTYDIYSAELSADVTGFIVNGVKDDGSGSLDQTPDITEFADSDCFYMVWADGNSVGKFTYPPEVEDDTDPTPVVVAYLAGSMNGWDTTATPIYADGGATLTLEAGTYTFKIVCDGAWYGNGGTIADTTATTSEIGWEMSNTADNCTLEATGGNYTFIFDAATKYLIINYVPSSGDGEEIDPSTPSEPEEPVTATYIIAGDSTAIFGTAWDPSNTANQMTLNAETGLYEKTYESVAIGTYAFKITDGTWTNAWGNGDDADGNTVFTLAAISNVTITFNAETKEIKVTSEATGETVDPVTDVTIHYRNTGLWSEVHAYGWMAGTDTTINGGWPGNTLTENTDHKNWYTVELAGLNAPSGIGILFNNGGDSGKTGDIMITENGEYWYDGQLLTEAPDTWADGSVENVEYEVTLHFADAKNWGYVNLYTWTNTGTLTGSWPGTALAQGEDGFYSMTVSYKAPEGQGLNFIFSGSSQTVDLALNASAFTKDENDIYTAEKWVVPTTTDGEGKFYADIVDAADAIAISPKVDGNTVTFQYKAPSAGSVFVAGTMNSWASAAMTKNEYGVWSVTLENVDCGLHQYKFIVDETWLLDPLNTWIYTEESGNQNSAFLISDPSLDTNTVKINVHFDAPSAEWNVCAWGAKDLDPQYDFVDGVTTITLDGRANQYVAFKVRKSIEGNDWAQQSGEIRVDLANIVSGTIDIWVNDDFSWSQSLNADVVYANKVKSVELNYDNNTIVIQTTKAVANAESAFVIYKDGALAEIIDEITVSGGSIILSLTENLDLVNLYRYKIAFLEDINEAYQGGIHVIGINTVYASEKFGNEFTYDGELGAIWTAGSTTFTVWAPTAASVSVNLYTSGTEGTEDLIQSVAMTKGDKGQWTVTVDGDLNGTYYTYAVTVDGETVEAVDPYARTTGVNGKRGMVIDLDSTDPEGWAEDKNPNPITSYTDAIIYELHVRDFSIDDSSGMVNKGKYLAFTEKGTTTANGAMTGIDYLESLGITHLHLLPVYDYGSVDETTCSNFNWGYDPVNYNTPEGSYSVDPYNGEVRVNEFKQMVMALHEADISVIMDVVYNHVYDAGKFCMNQIVPKYFSRVNADGSYSNGSGCGNDTASEREMVRKYIVESVLYWHEEYHIDGFRFDLVGLLDATTINQIVEEVHACCPDVIFYGEGWTLGTAVEPGNGMATQANSAETPDFAYFSDTIRNLLAGSNGSSLGYVSGQTGQEDAIRDNFMAMPWWTSSPTQIVQYASCHDNYTLIDKLILSTKKSGIDADIIKMNNLAAAIYMTSQGIPFIHAGEEFLREKLEEDGGRCENSYNASDYVNHIEWSNLENATYAANVEYYKGLIEFRKAHEALRLETRAEIDEYVTYSWVTNEVVMFTIDAKTAGDISDSIVVIFNANATAKDVALPTGDWSVCINATEAGTEVIDTVTDTVSVDGISAMVLVQGKNEPDHVHQWEDGECECGETCTHNFVDGTCTVCGMVCDHAVHWQNGLCSNCLAEVEHVYSENGLCSCGKSLCDHESHNINGMCDECGLAVGHTIDEDGICTVCTYNQNLIAFLKGSMNDWGEAPVCTLTSIGGTKVAGSVHLSADTYQFKIVYNDAWKGNSGTINSTASGWVMDSDSNCTLNAQYDGMYTFVYDTAANTLDVYNKITETLYLRGTFNEWGTDIALSGTGTNVQTATVTLEAGTYQFKVGNDDWTFGAPDQDISITVDRKSELTVTATYNGDGTWTVTQELKIIYPVVNSATGEGYDSLADALDAAKEGETVVLQEDVDEENVLVTPGVTLDLNGHTLTADYVVGFNTSKILDSSNNADNGYKPQGLLVVRDRDSMILAVDNGAVPVYNPAKGGYIFVDFLFQSEVEGTTVNMLVTSRTMEVIELLKSGAEDNDIKIVVRLTWDNDTGTAYQDFVFNEATVENVMNSNKGTFGSFGRMFYVTISGLENLTGVKASAMVIATCHAADSGETENVK